MSTNAQPDREPREAERPLGEILTAKEQTKQAIVSGIRRAARKLGRGPTGAELRSLCGISQQLVLRHFERMAVAVRAAGLEPRPENARLAEGVLLEVWGRLVRHLGRLPSKTEYVNRGRFSVAVFAKRFGRWSSIPGRFLACFKRRRGWARARKIVRTCLRRAERAAKPNILTGMRPRLRRMRMRRKLLSGRPTLGNPLDFRGMRYEPDNEAGVVFLFGAVCHELGLLVEVIQTSFPDCEALREASPGRWQRVRIEFEFLSRNYLRQGHSTKDCDLIVCWRHNWPSCPLEVLELSSAIKTLPSRP